VIYPAQVIITAKPPLSSKAQVTLRVFLKSRNEQESFGRISEEITSRCRNGTVFMPGEQQTQEQVIQASHGMS
jgi:hypothetical protein